MLRIAQDYFEAGYYVTPVNGKIPILEGWQTFKDYNDENFKTAKGLGILTGRQIVVVDIDYEDDVTKELIKPVLERFYTRVQRQGNKSRLPSLFYKTDKEIESIKFGKIEILGVGRQCVIPPSPHVLGHNYDWVYESLLEAGDYLPEFDYNLIDELRSVLPNGLSHDKTGRNSHLVKVVTAKIMEAKDPTTIINEIIEYDRNHHANHPKGPLFEDKNEGSRSCIPYFEAMRFYFSNARTQVNKKNFVVPFEIKIIEQKEPEYVEESHKNRKWETKFEGVLGEIFDYIYERSPQPHTRFVIPSVLTLVSTVLGNKVRYNNTLPNIFCLMIGTAASGKGKPLNMPSEMLKAVGLGKCSGLNSITHPAQINAVIERSPCRVDTIDEIHNLFRGMNSPGENPLKGAAELYSKLWDAPNSEWDGQFLVGEYKRNKLAADTGRCFSPYVNLIGACNIEMFTKYFNEDLASQGFASRLLFFMDDTKKSKYADDSIPSWMKPRPIPQRIKDFISYCQELTTFKAPKDNEPIDLTGKYEIQNVQMSGSAEKLFVNYCKKIELQAKKLSSEDAFMATVSRAERYFIKFALMDSVARSFETLGTPIIDTPSIKWAYSFIQEYLIEAKRIFKVFIGSDERDQAIKKVLNTIESSGQTGISKRNLRRKYNRMPTPLFNEVTRTLIESGQIKEETIGKSIVYAKES
jgi:hypothetical protein